MKTFASREKQIKFRPETFGYSVCDGKKAVRVNESFYDIFLHLCEGQTPGQICEGLKIQYPDVPEEYFNEDIAIVIDFARERRWADGLEDFTEYVHHTIPFELPEGDKPYPVAPDLVDLALTYDCNLFCAHCNVCGGEPAENELTTPEILDVIDQIYKMGTFKLVIMGGEPFVHPNLREILHFLYKDVYLHTVLVTNGTLLDKFELPDFMSDPRFCVTISIYEELLARPGFYDNLKKNIRRLKERGIAVDANYVLMNSTLDKVRTRYHELMEAGMDDVLFIKYAKAGRASQNEEIAYEQWAKFLQEMTEEKAAGRYCRMSILVTSPWEMYLPLHEKYSPDDIMQIWNYSSPLLAEHYREITTLGCNGGITSLFIGADGNTYPCGVIPRYAEAELGNIRERKLTDIWHHSQRINEFRRLTLDDISPICRDCQFTKFCGAGCRGVALATTGKYNGLDLRCPIVQQRLQEKV